MSDQALQKLRDAIDKIDDQLLELFNRRAECAVSVAEVKRNDSDSPADAINFFRPDREAQVIQRIKSINQGPLSDDEVGRLVREVMSACLALEHPSGFSLEASLIASLIPRSRSSSSTGLPGV